jgi:tellurite methyltransferase
MAMEPQENPTPQNSVAPFKTTVYDERYKSKANYWEFRPSTMAFKILEWMPPLGRRPKVLEIGCGEGGTSIFLARNGYAVTAFDLSPTALQKTRQNADQLEVSLQLFQADVNDFVPDDDYDLIFSSGTIQYLLPHKRKFFIDALKARTLKNGLNVLHTFVSKPYVKIAPDAESNEHLWSSGELLTYYSDWQTEAFIEEIKPCNSSGVLHEHAHNRIWSRQRDAK